MFTSVLVLAVVAVAASETLSPAEGSEKSLSLIRISRDVAPIVNQKRKNPIHSGIPFFFSNRPFQKPRVRSEEGSLSLTRERRALKPEPNEKRKNPIHSEIPFFFNNRPFQKPRVRSKEGSLELTFE